MRAKNVQAGTARKFAKAARHQKRFNESDIRLARAVVEDSHRRDRRVDDVVEKIASLPLKEDRAAG